MNISVSFLSLGHFYMLSYGFKADINKKCLSIQKLHESFFTGFYLK